MAWLNLDRPGKGFLITPKYKEDLLSRKGRGTDSPSLRPATARKLLQSNRLFLTRRPRNPISGPEMLGYDMDEHRRWQVLGEVVSHDLKVAKRAVT